MLAFYREVLGFATAFEVEGEIVFLRLDGDLGPQIALTAGGENAPPADPHWFLVIDVTGLDAVVADLETRGVEIGDIQDVPYGRAATFRDPEGNLLEVHEPTG